MFLGNCHKTASSVHWIWMIMGIPIPCFMAVFFRSLYFCVVAIVIGKYPRGHWLDTDNNLT